MRANALSMAIKYGSYNLKCGRGRFCYFQNNAGTRPINEIRHSSCLYSVLGKGITVKRFRQFFLPFIADSIF